MVHDAQLILAVVAVLVTLATFAIIDGVLPGLEILNVVLFAMLVSCLKANFVNSLAPSASEFTSFGSAGVRGGS